MKTLGCGVWRSAHALLQAVSGASRVACLFLRCGSVDAGSLLVGAERTGAVRCIAPGHEGAVLQDGCKCFLGGLQLPNSIEMSLIVAWPNAPVTTEPSVRIAANARSAACTCLTPLSLRWTALLSPPARGQPHVTTDPSTRMAAKTCSEA